MSMYARRRFGVLLMVAGVVAGLMVATSPSGPLTFPLALAAAFVVVGGWSMLTDSEQRPRRGARR